MSKDSKTKMLIAMMVDAPLTVAQMVEQGGIAKATARTFPTRLKRKGHTVVKVGTRGSYGYQILAAGEVGEVVATEPVDFNDAVDEAPAVAETPVV